MPHQGSIIVLVNCNTIAQHAAGCEPYRLPHMLPQMLSSMAHTTPSASFPSFAPQPLPGANAMEWTPVSPRVSRPLARRAHAPGARLTCGRRRQVAGLSAQDGAGALMQLLPCCAPWRQQHARRPQRSKRCKVHGHHGERKPAWAGGAARHSAHHAFWRALFHQRLGMSVGKETCELSWTQQPSIFLETGCICAYGHSLAPCGSAGLATSNMLRG
eukprot:351652-Chlamydomonas_euryale.AAC.14